MIQVVVGGRDSNNVATNTNDPAIQDLAGIITLDPLGIENLDGGGFRKLRIHFDNDKRPYFTDGRSRKYLTKEEITESGLDVVEAAGALDVPKAFTGEVSGGNLLLDRDNQNIAYTKFSYKLNALSFKHGFKYFRCWC